MINMHVRKKCFMVLTIVVNSLQSYEKIFTFANFPDENLQI